MEINKYPDGSSYVNNISVGLHNNSFRINGYESLWHLNQAVDAYWNVHKNKPTIIIPNLLDAQADRRFNTGESSGLKLVCKFLNGINANFKIFHPHNPEVVEAMMDNVEIIDNSDFIKRVMIKRAKDIKGSKKDFVESLILMSSDAGGFKPLMKLCEKLDWKGETASASKSRTYDKDGKTKLSQNLPRINFGGKDILIIDDISVYGGTFKGLATMLKDCNVGKLYLAVSHMTVQDLGNDPVTNYFDKVFTTNSKFDTYHYQEVREKGGSDIIKGMPKNLEIIKMF